MVSFTIEYSPPYFLFTRKYWASCRKSNADEGAAIRAARASKRKRKASEQVMDDYSGDLGST